MAKERPTPATTMRRSSTELPRQLGAGRSQGDGSAVLASQHNQSPSYIARKQGPRGLLSLPSPLTTTPRHSQEFRATTQGDGGGDTAGPQRDRQTDSPPQTGRGGEDTGPAVRCLSRRTAGLRPVRGSDPASRGVHPTIPGCQQPSPSSSDAERVNSRHLAPCPHPTLSPCFINSS